MINIHYFSFFDRILRCFHVNEIMLVKINSTNDIREEDCREVWRLSVSREWQKSDSVRK